MILEYELLRSNRKTIAAEIGAGGKLIVRAPYSVSVKKIEEFLESRRNWIERHAEMQRLREVCRPEPSEEERKCLLARAKEILPQKVKYYSALMGLYPTSVKITGARTRFGSCSSKNSICFSWRLMQYPEAAIDYVVVHELAHIKIKNHGSCFYLLVASVMPDWKKRRELLSK